MKVNFLAVLVAALAYFFLGFLWYGVLFTKPWMALEGVSAQTPQPPNMALHYLVTFLLQILLCYGLAVACHWRNAGLAGGAMLGIVIWILFIAPVTLSCYMFESRPLALFAINYGYDLAGMALAGAIVGGWKRKVV
jgi:hypothetical protein